MTRYFLIYILLAALSNVLAQSPIRIEGTVLNIDDKTPLFNTNIKIEGETKEVRTDAKGYFSFTTDKKGAIILALFKIDYLQKRVPLVLENKDLNLGVLFLEKDITYEKNINLISLTDEELLDDGSSSAALALLQSTRDIFLSRAAFDFGQAFFRVRGYDAQNGEVLLNGMPMNKLFDGRPQWNNWGGLNDVIRNQQFSNGLNASEFAFGGILGTTNIDLRPSGLRPGTRFSTSASNRTYSGRLMTTYNSGVGSNGLGYIVSASRRWAKEGFIQGTLYDAFSVYGALEYQINKNNTLSLTAMMASNRRGRSSAITEEVNELVGNRYNPYWGVQDGKIRNTRERKISEPLFLLNYKYESDKTTFDFGIAYQKGSNARSRLGYYNAPNPDPTYYRYLPSFYVNSPIGANFISARTAEKEFIEEPQINWERIYTANTGPSQNGKAAYVLYNDVNKDKQFTANTNGSFKLGELLKLNLGANFRILNSDNFARIDDLLGANFYEDLDTFSNTRNDVLTDVNKTEGELINYNYTLRGERVNVYSQIQFNYKKLQGFLSGSYTWESYQRDGIFKNERFLENSYGKSNLVKFSNFGTKGGITYNLSGRQWLSSNFAYINRAPILQNIFINPRESNTIVPNLQNEKLTSIEANYFLRLPKLTARLTGFYTRFQNTTDINFFFVDAGVGSDFVQEVLTDLDKLHAGTEIGLEYQLSSAVKLSFVSSVAKYLYASNPNVTINFDTAAAEDELIDISGSRSLGIADVKDYKLAQGPQSAFALGLEYRDPKYWWVGTTANYLGNSYASISTITRTGSFAIDPDTGQKFPEATDENIRELLRQKPLDNFYLLNIVGGKSWLKKGKYISIFGSINNAFDIVFKTGGYEQSRNGNYGQFRDDNLSGNPSFAPKYWYGYGRTYFLNLAYSF